MANYKHQYTRWHEKGGAFPIPYEIYRATYTGNAPIAPQDIGFVKVYHTGLCGGILGLTLGIIFIAVGASGGTVGLTIFGVLLLVGSIFACCYDGMTWRHRGKKLLKADIDRNIAERLEGKQISENQFIDSHVSTQVRAFKQVLRKPSKFGEPLLQNHAKSDDIDGTAPPAYPG